MFLVHTFKGGCFIFIQRCRISLPLFPLQPLRLPYCIWVAVISLLGYAAEYLASEVITKHNILANVHGARGHEQTLCFPSSLEISEL